MPLKKFEDNFSRLCQHLRRTKMSNRIAHAYLFAGDDRELLENFAQSWAQTCACMTPDSDGNACRNCTTCRLFNIQSYPEQLVLRPSSKSRRIPVEEVREFEHQLHLATSRDRLKIGLIVDADCLTPEGQNAFLKTLEEPPPATVLFLLTTQPRQLLPTIRSRCQNISLRKNKNRYDHALELGLFPLLAQLHWNAGAAVGLRIATRLQKIFDSLREQAEQRIGAETDERWATVAEDNPQLLKKLEEERQAKIAAEFTRLRTSLCDAIVSWFQQLFLICAETPTDLLPHPEILTAVEQAGIEIHTPSWNEAEENAHQAAQLVRCLNANVHEKLAVETFTLATTQVRQTRG